MAQMASKSDKIKELISLYREYGSANYIGERVTQVQHALQAADIAQQAGYTPQIVLGAFFHDIGHLIGEKNGLEKMVTEGNIIGVHEHDKLGQSYLESLGFKGHMPQLVGMHVQAKRYLVATVTGYYEKLSDASKMTLVHQGGAMNNDEVNAFEAHVLKDAVIQMRNWDDQAKDVNKYTTSLQVNAGLDWISKLLLQCPVEE